MKPDELATGVAVFAFVWLMVRIAVEIIFGGGGDDV